MGTVLIVDDEESVRQLLISMLSRSGYVTLAAATGEEALDLLISRRVDVVLADVLMPGQGGLWMTAEIRRRYPSLPVILVTGVPDVDPSVSLLDGVVEYIVKPFSRGAIERAITKALAWRDARTAGSPKATELDAWFQASDD